MESEKIDTNSIDTKNSLTLPKNYIGQDPTVLTHKRANSFSENIFDANEFDKDIENNSFRFKTERKKKKVSFKDDKNLVSIIEVESYKKYNAPIEIGGKKIKKKNEEKYPKKKRKDAEDQKEMEFADKYYDKDEDSGKSCNIF